MPNSMDIILVRFNRSETKFHSPSTACFEMPRLPKEFCCNGDTITLPEFLKIQPKDLTAEERKIQTALTRLYELNDREPPLFQSFPNWRNEKFPLTIDTTYIPEDQSCLASYNPEYNRITFEETNDPIILLESLAHELKHAEHCSREVYNLIGQHQNSLQSQQIHFLDEAQAYAFGFYVLSLDCQKCNVEIPFPVIQEHLKKHPKLDWASWQQSWILSMLPRLFESNYKQRYDQLDYQYGRPIHKQDKDLSDIPESFHIPKESQQEILKVLAQIPHESQYPTARFVQLLNDGYEHEAKKVLSMRDTNGDYLVSTTPGDYVKYLLQQGRGQEATPFLMELSSQKKPVIPDDIANKYMSEYLMKLPDKKAKEIFQKLQKRTPPCFSIIPQRFTETTASKNKHNSDKSSLKTTITKFVERITDSLSCTLGKLEKQTTDSQITSSCKKEKRSTTSKSQNKATSRDTK